MTALDLFRDTLRELDKHGSATMTIRDYAYFANSAVSEYINDNYRKLDILQKEEDDMRYFIKRNELLSINSAGEVNLPGDYRHMLGLQISVRFKKNMGRYKTTDVVQFYPERMKSGQKGERHRNAFGKPSYNRYYYEIIGTQLRVIFDNNVVEFTGTGNGRIDYVVIPTAIVLNPDTTVNYNEPVNNSVLQFAPDARNHVYFEVVKKIRDLFLENIESPRTAIAMQQSMARQE